MAPKKTPPPPPAAPPKPKKAAGPKAAAKTGWVHHAIKGIDIPLKKFTGPRRPLVPPIDPHYDFREEMVREMAWSVWPHDAGDAAVQLFVGPPGCGKTSLIMQVAAHCNVPVYRINLNVGTSVRHLKGRIGAEGGSTVFVPGVVTKAMEEGAWLILDEVSGATPPVAMALFPVLEPEGEVYLEDAQPPRYVKRHPDFRVFCTDNTIGAEQEDSRFNFGGTNPDMNAALLDRIGSTVQVGYLSMEREFNMIMSRVPAMDPDCLEGMIRTATNIRESDEIAAGFSTRMLMDWSRRYSAGKVDAAGKVQPYEMADVLGHRLPRLPQQDALPNRARCHRGGHPSPLHDPGR